MDPIDPELQAWLEVATESLAPYGKTRATEETIQFHLASYEAFLGEGLTPEEARRSALAALGDAKEAARAFEERLPTLEDMGEGEAPLQVTHDDELYPPTWRDSLLLIVVFTLLFAPFGLLFWQHIPMLLVGLGKVGLIIAGPALLFLVVLKPARDKLAAQGRFLLLVLQAPFVIYCCLIIPLLLTTNYLFSLEAEGKHFLLAFINTTPFLSTPFLCGFAYQYW